MKSNKKTLAPKKPSAQKKERFFEGLPVREGRADIIVQPTTGDIKQAKRHDPQNCAYAVCIKRMLGTQRVFVYMTICYIETLDENGNPVMERFMVRNHAHAYIQKFDKGEDVGPSGFVLHKPNASHTLEYKRKMSARWAKDHPDAVREFSRRQWQKKHAKHKPNWRPPSRTETTGSFRDGTGQVRFIGTADGKLDVNAYSNGESK